MRNILKNKRGNYGDVFVFIIMSFVIVVMFGLMYWGFTKMDTVLNSVQFNIGDSNFTSVLDKTWGQVYDAYAQLKTFAYVLIFGMMLTILVSAWMSKSPPIFLLIYIIVSLVAIITAVYISNAYQGLLANADFGSTLQSFKGGSFFLLYLPYLAGVLSLFSAVIGLIGLNRSRREERVEL